MGRSATQETLERWEAGALQEAESRPSQVETKERKKHSVPTAGQLSRLGMRTQPVKDKGSMQIRRTGSLVSRKGRYPG